MDGKVLVRSKNLEEEMVTDGTSKLWVVLVLVPALVLTSECWRCGGMLLLLLLLLAPAAAAEALSIAKYDEESGGCCGGSGANAAWDVSGADASERGGSCRRSSSKLMPRAIWTDVGSRARYCFQSGSSAGGGTMASPKTWIAMGPAGKKTEWCCCCCCCCWCVW